MGEREELLALAQIIDGRPTQYEPGGFAVEDSAPASDQALLKAKKIVDYLSRAQYTRQPGAMSLLEALRDCNCPRPANREPDDLTVGQCFDKLQCGCQNGVSIAAALRAPEAVDHSPDVGNMVAEAADAGVVALLQAEIERLTKRLDLLAVGFDVPDGGRYIADWQTRIAKYKVLSASPAADAGMRERATLAKAVDALREAQSQIVYMQSKFKETGSGNAVLGRISDAIKAAVSLPSTERKGGAE